MELEEMCYPFEIRGDAADGTIPVASFVRAVSLMGEKLTEAAEAELVAEVEPFTDDAGLVRYRDYIVAHLKEEHANKSKAAKRAPLVPRKKAPKSAAKTGDRPPAGKKNKLKNTQSGTKADNSDAGSGGGGDETTGKVM